MRPEIEELEGWYRGRAGNRAALSLATAVAPLVRRGATARLLALGYCGPLLEGFDPAWVERLILACPAEQGSIRWPATGANLAVEVDELSLPFIDSLFDQVLVVHSLEHAAPAAELLGELWRVLAPGGSAVIVVPNRAGVWVHMETTPFGQGTPFGRRQLRRMLEDARFELDHRQTLLAIPPVSLAGGLDRPVMKLLPGLGGLHIIRAIKREGPAMKPVGRTRNRRRRLAGAGLAPSPTC